MNLLIPSLDLFTRRLDILAIELKMNEEKECVYDEEAKLKVKVQAAQNIDMNKLDEDERQLRITEKKRWQCSYFFGRNWK